MTPALHLEAYLAECRVRRFDWRTFNCGHFAAGWVARAEKRELTLPTLSEQLRLRDQFGSVAGAVTVLIGCPPLDHRRMAESGDIILLPSKRADRSYVGICCGRHSAFLPMSGEELAFVNTELATFAWRVNKELLT